MPTVVINGKRVKVSDDFLSMSEADQHKTIDEIASHLGANNAPAMPSNEGMPAPRQGPLDTAWSAITGGRNLDRDLQQVREMTSLPSASDYASNVALRAQQAAETAQQGGQSAVQNFQAGRPASAVLGAGQQLLGGAGILMSPFTGAVKTYIGDPLERTLGYGTGEKANMIAETVLAPEVAAAAGRGAEMTANLGGRAFNAAQNNIFTGMGLNKLAKAVGETGPDLLNALRRNRELAVVESGPEAMAGERNVAVSKMAAPYERELPQVYEDIATKKAELLKGQAARAEAEITKDAQAAAADIAAPNQSEVGKDLSDMAHQTREQVKADIIRPAYDAAFKAAGNAKIDASGVVAKAEDILGQPLVDIPTKDMPATARALSKLQSTGPTLTDSTGAVIAQPKVQATLEQLDDVRKAINSDIAASKIAGNDPRLYELKQLHTAIDGAIKNSTSLDDMQKSLYQNALDQYRNEYTPRFKTGEAAKIFESRARNMAGINDEDVAAALVKGPTEAKSFVAMIGDNPDALKKAQEGIEGIYRDKVIKDGVIDKTAHDAFMQKYGPQIDILDNAGMNLKDKLNAAAQNTETALAPKATIEEIKKAGGNVTLPGGAKTTEIMSDVNDALQKLHPADVEAVTEIARRARAYADIKSPGTPIGEVNKPQFLSTAKRAVSEIYAALAKKLGDKQAQRISELFSTPQGTQAFIEQALKHKAIQEGRIVTGGDFRTPYAYTLGTNALAPQPNQNALAQ